MTDRPIIYSGAMVRALLREAETPGTGKTMTRRLAWVDTPSGDGSGRDGWRRKRGTNAMAWERPSPWQRVEPGDRLWVRETFLRANDMHGPSTPYYRANGENIPGPWTSPIHMPRALSRITLIVTAVKIERLQDITDADAVAEGAARPLAGTDRFDADLPMGVDHSPYATARDAFRDLWCWLHGRESWDANPAVVALTFTVHKANIDRLAHAGAAVRVA